MSRNIALSAGFAPVSNEAARVLILGSLPGRRSIECQQYYGHPQNAFWRIMRKLIAADGSYRERCAALKRNNIAVWDVLARSARPGSLDADIDLATAEVNDFEWFFAGHSAVGRICFNGQTAAKIFRQRVPDKVLPADIELLTLPSTSPAYAAMRFEQKLELWRSGIGMQSG